MHSLKKVTMSKSNYDPNYVEQYYDADPELEWNRLVRSPTDEIQLYIHNYYLHKYIKPECRVVEIGAGPGRFSKTLDEIGCTIVVTDISSGQLKANKVKAKEHGFAKSIEQWIKADVCEMPQLSSESFDAVIAYGGALSYVFERADDAAKECHRVLKANGVFLLSVMSLWGTMNRYLGAVFDIPIQYNREIVGTGNLTPETEPENRHRCHMFRADELHSLLARNRFNVIGMSASNSISTNQNETIDKIRQDPERWKALLEFEVEASASTGNTEAGTHIIAVAKKE